MLSIVEFQEKNRLEKIAVTKHARERSEERQIRMDDILYCIETGEIIKQYEDDKPLPSCLILGKVMEEKPLHIVVSKDEEFIYLITAYFSDKAQWKEDFRTRRER